MAQEFKLNYTGSEINNKLGKIDGLVEAEERLSNEIEVERARINSFTALGEGSTTGDAELQDIRVGFDGITYETAGEAVREQFYKLNGDIHGTKYIDGEICNGWTGATGTTWTIVDDKYQWLIVPVTANDVVDIGTNKTNATYALFLKSFSTPVVGETIDFADAISGYTYRDITGGVDRALTLNTRFTLMVNRKVSVTIPNGVNYVLLSTVVGGTSYPLEYLKVNGVESTDSLVNTVASLKNRVDGLEDAEDVANEKININIDNPYVRSYVINTQYSTDEWDTTNGHPYFTREDVSVYSEYVEGGKDKATPVTVYIAPHDGALSYKIIVSENPLYTNAKELNATTGVNKIYWLKINRVYWIKTIATTSEGDVVLTEKTIETNGVRRLNPTSSVCNMRDIGGQVTVDGKMLKQGLLYRSGRLMWITEDDVNLLENVLDIKLVVGLAQNTEDETKFSANVETYNTTDAGFGLPNGWDTLSTVETRQKYITYLRKIIEYLSQGKAVLIHCNGGADRTGLMSAMIEGLCGVSENDICKDYELTSFGIESGTIETGNPRMLSRTRLGSKNEDGTYRNVGFDGGIWVVRQQSGCETYADQWKKLLQSSDLAVDGFEPLTDAEIEALRKALIVEK